MADPEVTEAFNARNTYEYLVTLVGEKLQDKVYDMTETCNKIADILETNKSFSMTLVGRLVETIAANISSDEPATINIYSIQPIMPPHISAAVLHAVVIFPFV